MEHVQRGTGRVMLHHDRWARASATWSLYNGLNLRATVAASPLGNHGLYQTDVEDMFREMWLQYCNNYSEEGGLV